MSTTATSRARSSKRAAEREANRQALARLVAEGRRLRCLPSDDGSETLWIEEYRPTHQARWVDDPEWTEEPGWAVVELVEWAPGWEVWDWPRQDTREAAERMAEACCWHDAGIIENGRYLPLE